MVIVLVGLALVALAVVCCALAWLTAAAHHQPAGYQPPPPAPPERVTADRERTLWYPDGTVEAERTTVAYEGRDPAGWTERLQLPR